MFVYLSKEGESAKDEGEQQAGGMTVVGLTVREANKGEPNGWR